jgi:hypothetical protein
MSTSPTGVNPVSLAITLALQALSYVLTLIAQLKSDSGATDDAINAAALTVCGTNDALYEQMIMALKTPTSTPPAS